VTAGRPLQSPRPRPERSPAPPRAGEETWEKEADDVARREAGTSGDLRRRLGEQLGVDFSAVRVRPDDRSLPPGVGAETSGDTVRVAPGHFRPDLPIGRALLAHELAHVAQQGAAPRTDAGGLSGRGASIADPGGPRLSPAPRGMSQRTIGCSSPRRQSAEQSRNTAPAAPATAPTSAPATADWDFTRADYAALVRLGGALTFDADSAWFPQAFRDNLLATIAAVLDSSRQPISSEGVNTRDFYHGHVGVPNGTALPGEVTRARAPIDAVRSARPSSPTADNLAEYRRVDQETLPQAGALLERTARIPGVVVVYHTFETNLPSGIGVGDPLRNWLTPLDTNQPATFTPPDPTSASSWTDNYWSVIQFAFLIDAQGRIHVRLGTVRDLSTVTGRPEEFGR
jgi:hypothetical protein